MVSEQEGMSEMTEHMKLPEDKKQKSRQKSKANSGSDAVGVLDNCILVLGGAGLVGSQIVREVGYKLRPGKIVVAGLYQGEVEKFIEVVSMEFPDIEFVGAWGNVFVRDALRDHGRENMLDDDESREMLFEDLYGDIDEAYERSTLTRLIVEHAPNVIVDCINTATALGYQGVNKISRRTHDMFTSLDCPPPSLKFNERGVPSCQLVDEVSTLLISQPNAQLIRHVRLLYRVMREVGTRLYLKLGTTGTGGMGLNIPYTHSEDRPSFQLMMKTGMAFAHTGLLFLMARTPGGPLVKELKPAGMIGYRSVRYTSVKRNGHRQQLFESKREVLSGELELSADEGEYELLGELKMAGVDTGENGFFARGEFETITYIDQMEFLTPEEIAEQAVLEIKGSNTGHDVIAGLDSSIMSPSYRAGVLRQSAIEELVELERKTNGHSVALGELGPPELSKLLYEAHILKLIYSTLEAVCETSAEDISATLQAYLEKDNELRTQIISIGIPILSPGGESVERGPRINIPESINETVMVDAEAINRWACAGWVDLRPENMKVWQERFEHMRRLRDSSRTVGTAYASQSIYPYDTIEIGAVVAWIFANEIGSYRIK